MSINRVRALATKRTYPSSGTQPADGVTWAIGLVPAYGETLNGLTPPPIGYADSANPNGCNVTFSGGGDVATLQVELPYPTFAGGFEGQASFFITHYDISSGFYNVSVTVWPGGYDSSLPQNDWFVCRYITNEIIDRLYQGSWFRTSGGMIGEVHERTVYLYADYTTPDPGVVYFQTGATWNFGVDVPGNSFSYTVPISSEPQIIRGTLTLEGTRNGVEQTGVIPVTILVGNNAPVALASSNVNPLTSTLDSDTIEAFDDGSYDPGYGVSAYYDYNDTGSEIKLLFPNGRTWGGTAADGAIVGWEWKLYLVEDLGETSTETLITTQSGTSDHFSYEIDEPGFYYLYLRVTDSWGGISDSFHSVYIGFSIIVGGFFGALIDQSKILYTAVTTNNDGESALCIYSFREGANSRETLSMIPGYKLGSLWSDAWGVFYCSGQSTASGEYHVFKSQNRGLSWAQWTVSTMWGINYKKGQDCGVPVGGGAASCALLAVDSNTQKVLFKYAPDGKTWPTDADAVVIATLTGADRIKSIQVRQVPGSIELRATDGSAKVWHSFKHGVADSWSLMP